MDFASFPEYFGVYQNCLDYCLDDTDCVEDIKQQFPDYCKEDTPVACDTAQYKPLFVKLAKIVKLIYTLRAMHGNEYDQYFILLVGHVEPYDNMECMKFSSYSVGMPNNLAEYFDIMRALAVTHDESVLGKYVKFTQDYQPWTTYLVDFLNQYAGDVLRELYGFDTFPPISNISNYGKFANDLCYKRIISSQRSLIEPNYTSILHKLNSKRKSTKKVKFPSRSRRLSVRSKPSASVRNQSRASVRSKLSTI